MLPYTEQQGADLLAILLSPQPEAPKPAPAAKREYKSRHFYRCADCLAVAATESKLAYKKDERGYTTDDINATCDACGGRIEYMGETKREVLTRIDGYRPACDGKCIGAHGPNCDCQCGGENHGKGVMVPIYTDTPIPRLGIPKNAARKGEEYRALLQQFRDTWNARYKAPTERKRYEYLSGENYGRYMDGQHLWGEYLKVKALRTHAARNKKLGNLIERAQKGVRY